MNKENDIFLNYWEKKNDNLCELLWISCRMNKLIPADDIDELSREHFLSRKLSKFGMKNNFGENEQKTIMLTECDLIDQHHGTVSWPSWPLVKIT